MGLDFSIKAPVRLLMEVYVIEALAKPNEPARKGTIKVSLGFGRFPTEAELREQIRQVEGNLANLAGPGFRLMNKRELWGHICLETYGEEYALPGSPEFDA